MSTIENEFGFIGWNNEANHDKVWGYFYRPTSVPPVSQTPWWNPGPTKENGWNCCVFWAARGKAMQFKPDVTGETLSKLVRSKLKKGYNKITADKLIEIWPTFIQEAEAKLMWDILAGKVK